MSQSNSVLGLLKEINELYCSTAFADYVPVLPNLFCVTMKRPFLKWRRYSLLTADNYCNGSVMRQIASIPCSSLKKAIYLRNLKRLSGLRHYCHFRGMY